MMPDFHTQLPQILEAALLASGRPLRLAQLDALFSEEQRPSRNEILTALSRLGEQYADRGIELVEVAAGFRIQVRQAYAPWVSRLWEEKQPRYSRALLETLALIAYRQPVTRGEIEAVRGVAVGSNLIRTLVEREWIRTVGHRDVPGRPALYATTREFLGYFNLKSLDELPPLKEVRDLDAINWELDLDTPVPAVALPATDPQAAAAEQEGDPH